MKGFGLKTNLPCDSISSFFNDVIEYIYIYIYIYIYMNDNASELIFCIKKTTLNEYLVFTCTILAI